MDALARKIFAPGVHSPTSSLLPGGKIELNSPALAMFPRRKSCVALVSSKQKEISRQGKTKTRSRARVVVQEPKHLFETGPSPPAGFVLDDAGDVVLVAPAEKRVVDMIDPETGRLLECLVRRAFVSSGGLQCLLLTPLDTFALQSLKYDEENEALREISDEELEEVLPTVEYTLAKKRLHFVLSGFCFTARGCVCFSEDDILELETDGSITEGIEIAAFRVGTGEFVIFTSLDPLLFVSCKDETTGELTVADDDLMRDPGVANAVKDEAEFQQFVEAGGY